VVEEEVVVEEVVVLVVVLENSNLVPHPTYPAHLPSININNKPRTQRQRKSDCQNTRENWWAWRKAQRGEAAPWKTDGAESRLFFLCPDF